MPPTLPSCSGRVGEHLVSGQMVYLSQLGKSRETRRACKTRPVATSQQYSLSTTTSREENTSWKRAITPVLASNLGPNVRATTATIGRAMSGVGFSPPGAKLSAAGAEKHIDISEQLCAALREVSEGVGEGIEVGRPCNATDEMVGGG